MDLDNTVPSCILLPCGAHKSSFDEDAEARCLRIKTWLMECFQNFSTTYNNTVYEEVDAGVDEKKEM